MIAALLVLGSAVAQSVNEVDGVAVFEAESFNTNLSPRSAHGWTLNTALSGFSGSGYMESTPNNGANLTATNASPELRFSVNFTTAGTHYLWFRGSAASDADNSVHLGIDSGGSAAMTLNQTGVWQWSAALQANGSPATINVPTAGIHTINVWMREDGLRLDRLLLTTTPGFAARVGNAWHIPNNAELPGGVTMRSPLTVFPGTPVKIYNGSQFQGAGDPGNQLQNGSTIFYKRTTDAVWSSVPMTFQSEAVYNKYYAGTLPAFNGGETVKYYLRIPFSDHLPTFLYGTDGLSQSTEIESVAKVNPFTFTVPVPVHPGNTTLNLPADLPAASGYLTENALGGLTFNQPIDIAVPPGETNSLFVVEREGTIQVVTNLNSTPVKQVFLDLFAYLNAAGGGTLPTFSEQGLLGLAFHPNYAQNGYFYVFYSVTINDAGTSKTFERVARFQVSAGNPNQANPSTHTPLISQLDEDGSHNGGDLQFGPDGYLYISVGDEGGANDQYDNARFINKDFFAAILRIDVDKKPGSLAPNPHAQNSATYPSAVHAGTYTIPADNPFVGTTSHSGVNFSAGTVRTEIWAAGLRNPFQFSFDAPTGRLFAGDVGQNAWEEIDIIQRGGDYGWSYFEANHDGPRIASKPVGLTYAAPIYEYAHGTGTFSGDSVTGGVVYRGARFSELFEAYIFADFISGQIWALRQNGAVWSPTLLANDGGIVAMASDPRNGDTLFADILDGKISRLVRAGTTGTNPPALLSQTGAFSNLALLTPNAGIRAYAPNVSFWSDYAIKSRWFSVPNAAATINFSQDGNWTFPTGTTWIKHFDFEMRDGDPTSQRKLETRFLVKTNTSTYGITYRWRADQSDANLVAEEGLNEVLNVEVGGVATTQIWRYPSRNDCRTCHTPVAGHALSFNTRQMNRANQIQAISAAGYFSSPVTGVNNMPAFAPASDTTQSLEWRVRSYLAVNCVQCHQPGGASLGNWDARSTTPTDSANIINGLLADIHGDSANRFAVPGDTGHSMVLQRLQGAGVPRMPPLATNELDPDAIQLLTDWITQTLPQRQSFSQWQIANFGSLTAAGALATDDPDGDGQNNEHEFLANTVPKNAASVMSPAVISPLAGAFQLTFMQPANRSALVETSTDLGTWALWDVAENAPSYPATAAARTFNFPLDDDRRFFRLRLSEP